MTLFFKSLPSDWRLNGIFFHCKDFITHKRLKMKVWIIVFKTLFLSDYNCHNLGQIELSINSASNKLYQLIRPGNGKIKVVNIIRSPKDTIPNESDGVGKTFLFFSLWFHLKNHPELVYVKIVDLNLCSVFLSVPILNHYLFIWHFCTLLIFIFSRAAVSGCSNSKYTQQYTIRCILWNIWKYYREYLF